MNRNEYGFSYAEVIVALAIFCVAASVVFPSLSQARRNADYAARAYEAQLLAGDLTLAVKIALNSGVPPVPAADACVSFAGERFAYAFWVSDAAGDIILSHASADAPAFDIQAQYAGWASGKIIVAAVYDTEGRMLGHSVGMAD